MTIHEILHKQYPAALLKIADKRYHRPNREYLWKELVSSYMEDYKYLAEITDCDDFTLFLHAWIRQQQYKEKWDKPLAFGEAWSAQHALNIAVLDTNEVVLVEPQNDYILSADAHDIVFVRM
jgi:hypothetical protein